VHGGSGSPWTHSLRKLCWVSDPCLGHISTHTHACTTHAHTHYTPAHTHTHTTPHTPHTHTPAHTHTHTTCPHTYHHTHTHTFPTHTLHTHAPRHHLTPACTHPTHCHLLHARNAPRYARLCARTRTRHAARDTRRGQWAFSSIKRSTAHGFGLSPRANKCRTMPTILPQPRLFRHHRGSHRCACAFAHAHTRCLGDGVLDAPCFPPHYCPGLPYRTQRTGALLLWQAEKPDARQPRHNLSGRGRPDGGAAFKRTATRFTWDMTLLLDHQPYTRSVYRTPPPPPHR